MHLSAKYKTRDQEFYPKQFMKKTLYSSLIVLIASAMSLHSASVVWTWTGDAGNNHWKLAGNWSYLPLDPAPPATFPDAPNSTDYAAVIFGDFGAEPLTVAQTGGGQASGALSLSRIQVTSAAQADLTISFASQSVLGKNSSMEGNNPVVQIATGKNVLFSGASGGLRMGSESYSATWQVDAGATLSTAMWIEHNNFGSQREIIKTGAGTWNYEATQIGRTHATNGPRTVSLTIGEGTFAFNPGTANDILYYGSNTVTPTFTIQTGATLAMDLGASGDKVQFLNNTTSTLLTNGGFLEIEEGALLQLNRLTGFEHNQWYTLFESINTAPEYDLTVSNLLFGEQALFRTISIDGFDSYSYQVMIAPIPEPGTIGMVLIGALGLAMRRRYARQHRP